MTLAGNRKVLPTPGYGRIWSNEQLAGLEMTDGQLLPVSNADECRVRYNDATGVLEVSINAGAYEEVLASDGSTYTDDRFLTNVGSPHAALDTDTGVGIDTTLGVATYTLPPVGTSEGRNIFVYDWGQNASVNPITVAAQGGETINGVASIDITVDGTGAWCKCHGGVWKTVAPV